MVFPPTSHGSARPAVLARAYMRSRSRQSAFRGGSIKHQRLFPSLWRFMAVRTMVCFLPLRGGWFHGFRGFLAARVSPALAKLCPGRGLAWWESGEKSHRLRRAAGIISLNTETHAGAFINWRPIHEWTDLTSK